MLPPVVMAICRVFNYAGQHPVDTSEVSVLVGGQSG